jgi:hypothetical protein
MIWQDDCFCSLSKILEAIMARQENSVQFSLKELVQLESDRRRSEEEKARQRLEDEARARAEAEANARQLRVQAEAKRAAELAAQEARVEAEAMLAAERARISQEESSYVAPQRVQARSSSWMGFAAMALSVVGLGTSLLFIASQPNVSAVKVLDQTISVNKLETVEVPFTGVEKVTTVEDDTKKPEPKVVKPVVKKDPKDTKPACDFKKDPTCGISSSRD